MAQIEATSTGHLSFSGQSWSAASQPGPVVKSSYSPSSSTPSVMQLTSSAMMKWLPLVILFSIWCVHAKKDGGPRITKTKFEAEPSNLQYFNDTDTILIQERELGHVWRSEDGGEEWEKLEDLKHASDVFMHPYDNQTAYVLTRKHKHWVTHDQGKKWTPFKTGSATPSDFRLPLSFHAGDSKKVLFNAQKCTGLSCKESAYYTTDGFKTTKKLRDDTRGCYFAHSTPLFKASDDKDDSRILCVARGRYSSRFSDNRLLMSDSYFEGKDEHEPLLEEGRTVQGIINIAVVKGFLVAAAKAESTTELALYVTDDAKIWHRAEFPRSHKVEENAYTILESTSYSIQVDVMTTRPSSAMGVLFSSNSNGTYFTELISHTNRNYQGIVDFEKMQNIQGIVFVNVVDNWEEVERTDMTRKKVKSKISFDDGRTFKPLTTGKNEIHLHSVTDMSNSGKVYSSLAPGLAMGIGNTGDYLKPYDEGDLYVSDDAGLTWKKRLSEAHKYEFGDQGSILLAIYDEGAAKEISWSIDHGSNWEKTKLEHEVRARVLTTTPDSTSLKFVLVGTEGGGADTEFFVYSFDFDGLHERKCEEDDMDKWYARLDDKGEPDCLMGHKQYFIRRKADADCFVASRFEDPTVAYEVCKCTKEDFECDYNFVRNSDGKCIPAGILPVPDGACKEDEKTFEGTSGLRLIPGNVCKGGLELDKETIKRPCEETVQKPSSGKVSHEPTTFKAKGFRSYYYMERAKTSHGNDETVMMLTDDHKVYMSRDHGKTWKIPSELKDEVILALVPHTYDTDAMFFLTAGKQVFYTINRGETFSSFEAPQPPNMEDLPILSFHARFKGWLIWTGAVDCPSKGKCHSDAFYSPSRGAEWTTLLSYVRKCEFIKQEDRGDSEKLVYCEQREDEVPEGRLQLLSSDNWFADSKPHFDDIVTFATMAEFIIVANKNPDGSLKVDASVDGQTFADAEFPKGFNVPNQRAYTVLDSSTHAIFLHVTVSGEQNFEYGKLMKSNSNGTSYVHSIGAVNRNGAGYVDFEKMQGLEGVALLNVVRNFDEEGQHKAKILRTMITHNDGAQWAPLQAPRLDAEDNDYGCDPEDTENCSLHLHGYTERTDPRHTYSSPSAVGLMMGVGNVGKHLIDKADGDTFITRDGGINWVSVKKGSYLWEYGDQGSIIVIVEDGKTRVATDHVFYTLDEGQTWKKYVFSESPMFIDDLSTVPSDNSQNFLLWGQNTRNSREIVTINLDFSGLRDRWCVLNEEDPADPKSDYTLWAPKHPLQDSNCLFGHVMQYHRKKPEADCFNGRMIEHLHDIAENCTCTRQDFEW